MIKETEIPFNAFRLTLELGTARNRLDQILLLELRSQKRSLALRTISRAKFKDLFKSKRIRIKGQPAVPSSSIAVGITHIDILGFPEGT